MIYAKVHFDSTLFGVDYYQVELWSKGSDEEPDKQLKYSNRIPGDKISDYLRREL